jgi:hypothetical protein
VIISKIFQGLVISHGDPVIKASLPFAPFNSSLTANPSAPLKDRQTSPTICKNKIRRWWGRRFGVWPCSSTTSLTLAFFWWINTFDFPLHRIEILFQAYYYFRDPNAIRHPGKAKRKSALPGCLYSRDVGGDVQLRRLDSRTGAKVIGHKGVRLSSQIMLAEQPLFTGGWLSLVIIMQRIVMLYQVDNVFQNPNAED